MAFHAQAQGFDALQSHPRVVWRDARAQVSERAGEHTQLVGQWEKWCWQVNAPAQAVVAGVGLGIHRMLATCPVKLAAVDHDAADARAVTSQPLGQGVADDICAVSNRLREVGRREGRVDNQRDAVIVSDLSNRFQIADFQRWVGASLSTESAHPRRKRLV